MKKQILYKIIILFLTIFFLIKVKLLENTLLQLNKNTKIERYYPIFSDEEALLVLKGKVDDKLYVKELLQINDGYIGNTYNYKEVYEKNFEFKWLEEDDFYNKPNYNEEKREKEYNRNTGYFLIKNNEEIYGLSEEEIKKILDISSLKLENPEKYMKKNGKRLCLTKFYQERFIKIFNLSNSYDYIEFEKGNPAVVSEVNKLIFVKNIIIIYLGINLILCIILLFKKNIKNLKNYMKIKEKRIWFLYSLDFSILFAYCFLYLFFEIDKVIELDKFIFYYIVIKNFLLYYYLKLRKKKFRKLIGISYLILIFIILIKIIKINSIFYYLVYLFSILYFPILSVRKKENLKSIVLINSLYLVIQLFYLAIVFLWLYKIF